MKHYFLFIVLFAAFFSPVLSSGQINLVPNPSFEDTLYCPPGVNNLEAATGWLNFGNSPDYWNECGYGAAGIPNLSFGYQFAHTGKGIVGIGLYRRPNSPNGPNYREFIGIQLQQQLIPGFKYYFSFYLNFSCQLPVAIACNKAGLRFSTIPYDSCCPPPINNWAHFYSDSIYKDSVDWAFLKGSFIADSAYNYIILGNFFDDSNTDTLRIGNLPDHSYYYLDDICVTTDSLYNLNWTSTKDIGKTNLISIFPNPTTDNLSVISSESILSYKIYNYLGQMLFYEKHEKINSLESISVSHLSQGYYLIEILTRHYTSTLNFIKN